MLNVFKKHKDETMENRVAFGTKAENSIVRFITKQGMRVVARNVAYSHGEIDIVAKDQKTVVCIEVKACRSTNEAFAPEYHFDHKKAQKVQMLFEQYLAENGYTESPSRIDLACVVVDAEQETIRYYKHVAA